MSNWILSLVFLLYALPIQADTLQGRVVAIADGDTVTVLDAANVQTKIRLQGIDAPEKKQAFGQKSKQHLSDLVFNKQVIIEYSKKDRYGRTIGKIVVDGVDANLEQVNAGMAWHYKKYLREQPPEDRVSYSNAEGEARAKHLGLWVNPSPIPPWEFRHK
jgi:endonuclease YncB( thermonuclease family)